MKRLTVLVAAGLLALVTSAQAYTLVFVEDGGQLAARRWPDGSQSILFQINQDTGPGLPNMAAGSDPLAAVQRGIQAWPPLANIHLDSQMTSVESAVNDGVNVITLKSTAANLMALEMAGNPLGLALVRSQGTSIVEADVIVNPSRVFTTTLDTDAALAMAGFQDLEAVVTHEIGHTLGLHHSGIEAATMWSLASVLHRTPSDDDHAAVRALYPPAPTAAIFGEVNATESLDAGLFTPVFGAQVVALNGGRVAASALTLPDGSYRIDGLEGGSYTVYVEPLDGPHSPVPDIPCVRLGNLSGGGIFSNAMLDTDVSTTFFGGNATPMEVQVAAGAEAQVSFMLARDASEVNPTLIGLATIDGGNISLSVGGSPVLLVAGRTQAIAVAGANLDMVPAAGISFEDPAITIDTGSLRQLEINCNGMNLPVLAFEVTVAAGAASGPRSLALRVGNDLSMMTGAIDVSGVDLPTPTPMATASATQPLPTATPVQGCVGDCDGSGTVTVDEIVTMVNIALGSLPVSNCPSGDSDSSGSITVDEILTAIQNALNGCA